MSRTRVEQDFLTGFDTIGTPNFYAFMEKHLREDCEFVCNCPQTLLRAGGTLLGRASALQAMLSFFAEFEALATSVGDIVVDGAHVVVNYSMLLRHIGTGRSGHISSMNHYVLDADRKVTRMRVYFDNASIAAVGDLLDAFAEAVRGLDRLNGSPERRPKRFRGDAAV